tara:strand:+ start:218 stop:541 length:324 start_codon:yes stop_codon:yes gene_type:complete
MITSDISSGSSSCKAGIDLGLAAAAFGQRVTLVFSGCGMPLLYKDPNAEGDTHRLLGSAPFYDIRKCYALLPEISSQTEFRNDIPIQIINAEKFHSILATADVVLNY